MEVLDNIKERTLEELGVDYNGDVAEFIADLEERISLGNYINDKYKVNFKPVNVDFLKQQRDFLVKEFDLAEISYEDNEKYDIINKAPHYNCGKYECIEVMQEVFGEEKLKIWCILNAFKYLYRCYKKNGNEDLRKATYYLNYIEKNLMNDDKEN